MKTRLLVREQRLELPLDEVFEFYSQARNLERITPPWLRFKLVEPAPRELRAGSLIGYRLRIHAVPVRWLTEIEVWEPGRAFVDRQLQGPYRLWRHLHEFRTGADGATHVRDEVRYAMPYGVFGDIAHALLVRRDLERIFDYRQAAVAELAAARQLV